MKKNIYILKKKWTTNKGLLYSTGDTVNVMWQAGWERSLEENGHIYTYDWVTLLSAWNYHKTLISYLLSSVQSLSHVQIFATPWTAARQASLSITNSRTLLKLMSIESVMTSNHLILCCPLLLPPSIFPSIRVFSNESALCIRWPKYWSFSFNISPSNEHTGLISFRMDWLDLLQSKGLSRVFSNTTVQKHQFFSAQLSL